MRGRQVLDERSLIEGAAGPLEPPIRSMLFGQARFEQHGHSLAKAHAVLAGQRSGENFFPRLRSNIESLQQTRRLLEQRALEGRHLGPAAHWLLDNAPLIDEQLYAIRRGLPRSFFRQLPRLRDEPLAGLPRIYGIAWAWVAHTDSGFDAALLSAYLRAYQTERDLSLAELWALPTTLRVVLVENLRRLAERSVTQQAARDAAHRWFDKPDRSMAELDMLEQGIRARGVAEAFFLQLEHRQEELPPVQLQALDAWLSGRLPDPVGALSHQQSETTEDQQSIRNAIVSLRQLDRIDWRSLIKGCSSAMQVLQESPVHSAEAEVSQDETLHAVERLARRSGRSEAVVARQIVQLTQTSADPDAPAAAPAHWWRGSGRAQLYRALDLPQPWWPAACSPLRRSLLSGAYLASITGLTGASVAWLLWRQADATAPGWLLGACALLLLGPASEAVVALVNRLISESARPVLLPRLAFEDGLPEGQRSLVVMPVLLNSPAAINALGAQLEQHYLANPEAHSQFALLSDMADADTEHLDTDARLLAAAETTVAVLNLRHPSVKGTPPRFLLLHRRRQWSETEQRWIGWERKRGKLEQLVRVLADPTASSPFLPLGALSNLALQTRYIITLDADTDLPPGRLRALVGMAAHPLNLPQLDATGTRIVGGYGILQPRVMTPLPRPEQATPYHTLFSGQGGIDPYSAASSEIYQDLFGEGTFTGKGLLHVGALHAVLAGRLPEGQVLSHDLLEGAIARCASASDITLMEDSPFHADVAAARLHRWTRGDWQLLPFLARWQRYPCAAISRWKMIDNLRRSLVVPMSLALLLLVLSSSVLPLAWALVVVAAAFSAGPLLGAVAGFAPSRDDIALLRFYRLAGRELLRALALAVWHGAQLLQLSLMYLDAIARALYRQFVSRRHLLAWTTAEAAQAAARTELGALARLHLRTPLVALALLIALIAADTLGAPVNVPASVLLLALWAAAPLWTWAASQPHKGSPQGKLDEDSRDYLQTLASDTWRYYEQHIGPDDQHLPPDNVQQVPQRMVAHRTSPTNIGLYLLAVTCARELGFIGTASMTERLQATLATLERLPRWRGHFYNWYDTQTLAVLMPAYVSTVDSGNCSAHLLAVARACELATQGSDGAPRLQGVHRAAERLRAVQPLLGGAPVLQSLANEMSSDSLPWPQTLPEARVMQVRLLKARSEMASLDHSSSRDAASWLMHDLISSSESALRDSMEDTIELHTRLLLIAQRLRQIALEAEYAPLYDRERRLLHIGYRVEAQQLDDNHYDLLASEARLTSLIAIAKGDVPVEHWSALGRPLYAEGSEVGLKSWSGSMFEYLMPSLVLDEPAASVLGQVGRSAVLEQRAEARGHGTPWGISESAIAGQDHSLAYQYGPQGAPRLALRRMPLDERVLAPYATLLAALVEPAEAVANLRALQQLGARGSLGFMEALDYTPTRQAEGSAFTLVQTYMTHHQAMGLVAITNLLADNAPRRWMSSDPHLRAVASLLHERAPNEVAPLCSAPPATQPRGPRSARLLREIEPLLEAPPATQLLTNGRYALMLRSHGGGYSVWDGIGLGRWRDDMPRDAHGSFFYLQRPGSGNSVDKPWHSITAHPAPDPAARYRCRMQADRVIFDAVWPDLDSRCTTWVSPEDDCELRQIELCNTGNTPLLLNLAACFEVTLAPHKADEAHPAFSNLFIKMRWEGATQVLHMLRRPRLADEQSLRAVHFLAGVEGPEGALEAISPCTDRARWLGRYGSPAQPLGDGGCTQLEDETEDGAGEGSGLTVDTGLDPLAGLMLRLKLAPGAHLRLTFCTAAAHAAETLEALVDKYRQNAHVERAASMSHTMAGIRLRELQFDADTWGAMLDLNTLVSGQTTRDAMHLLTGRCDRRVLWRHGISGDRPIIWVAISGEDGIALVQTLKKALRLWTACGLGVDLVVSNGEPNSYLAPVQQQLQALQARHEARHHERPVHLRSSLHLLREHELSADERTTLSTLARLKLQADGRSLAQQMERWRDEQQRDFDVRRSIRLLPVSAPLPRRQRGIALPPDGRFHAETGAFAFELTPARHPARPWVNVLANPDFGCQVSELAGGYTWAGNSRMHQLTPWSNDPLGDPPGEWLLLHDLDQSKVWPLGRHLHEQAPAEVEHGIGFTRRRQRFEGLSVTLTWCVDTREPLKQVQVEVQVLSGPRRRLRLVAMAEWQLGSARLERLSVTTQPSWLSAGPEGAGLPEPAQVLALQATQLDHLGGFGQATAFLALRPADDVNSATRLLPQDWTCDRREFFDSAGQMVLPAQLGRRSGAGLDACAALAAAMELQPQQSSTLTLLLGHGANPAAAQALLARAWLVEPAERLRQQREQWPALLGGVQVHTPDPQFDALVNHWLPYQTLVCRIWARAGFYQAGGAFGFRDQLQDAMALVSRMPSLLAEQILKCAARQFPEGDVQHWWHEPGGAGVRTHFSDDRLWLPYAVAHYLQRTGDVALLDRMLPFLVGQAIPAGAEDIYETPAIGNGPASLYEHAARAIDRSLASGAHGLPLFGSGDWNDGMNRVGHEGRGESVWLAWFLCQVIDDFAPVAAARQDTARVQAWTAARQGWARALDTQAWDGRWYVRGFFDDGTPLGSASQEECRIDLIAQAWAVLSGAGEPGRAREAMASACSRLIDGPNNLVRLLDPPLAHARPSAGYIQAYPPGVRENGGQYNHAGVWALMALAQLGQRESMWQVFRALSPAHRWLDRRRGSTYAIEPYVMAGDVYTQPPYVGRGGWSWYTGSAGWLMRASVESICGVVLAEGHVTVKPCLPAHWPAAEVVLRHEGAWHRFLVCTDEATADEAQALQPQALRARVGESIDLAKWPAGSVQVLVAPSPALLLAGAPEPILDQNNVKLSQ